MSSCTLAAVLAAILLTPSPSEETDGLCGGSSGEVKEKNDAHGLTECPFPFLSVTAPESTVLETVLRHSKLVQEAIQQTAGCEHLSSEEEHLAETMKEVGSGGQVEVCRVWRSVELCRVDAQPHLSPLQHAFCMPSASLAPQSTIAFSSPAPSGR